MALPHSFNLNIGFENYALGPEILTKMYPKIRKNTSWGWAGPSSGQAGIWLYFAFSESSPKMKKNYETYNNEQKEQVFASSSKFQIIRFR